MKQEQKRNIVSILVHNNPRVLMKISGLMARKGFNIKNLSLGRTKRKDMSRITVVLESRNGEVDRLKNELYKVIQTVRVLSVEPGENIEKELAFITVRPRNLLKSEFAHLIKAFGGKIIECKGDYFLVELTGNSERIDLFINAVGKSNIIDIVSSGVVAIDRLKNDKMTGGN